jgi:cytidylate kinase
MDGDADERVHLHRQPRDEDRDVPLRGVIALDGPSGTGKSTVAQAVAMRLGLRYLDTGATYRAVTLAVLQRAVDPMDGEAVGRVAEAVTVDVSTDPHDLWVTLDGLRVDRQIRSGPVTAAVSPVSAVPRVRRRLVNEQRKLIGDGDIVVEGRDIGTVVAPDAPLKVFLTASQDARAYRRARQDGTDATADIAATAAALEQRDRYDSARELSPLRAAEDAVHVDTTRLAIDEVVQRLVDLARSRGIGAVLAAGRRGADGSRR